MKYFLLLWKALNFIYYFFCRKMSALSIQLSVILWGLFSGVCGMFLNPYFNVVIHRYLRLEGSRKYFPFCWTFFFNIIFSYFSNKIQISTLSFAYISKVENIILAFGLISNFSDFWSKCKFIQVFVRKKRAIFSSDI